MRKLLLGAFVDISETLFYIEQQIALDLTTSYLLYYYSQQEGKNQVYMSEVGAIYFDDYQTVYEREYLLHTHHLCVFFAKLKNMRLCAF